MSLPITPTESMSQWTAVVRTDNGPTVEIDVDTSTPSTPSSSPLREACQIQYPHRSLDQHHVIALGSPSSGRRRIILSSNRDDLAMRATIKGRTDLLSRDESTTALEIKALKEMMAAGKVEGQAREAKEAAWKAEMEAALKAETEAREALQGQISVLESKVSAQDGDLKELYRDKLEVVSHGVFKFSALRCCPHLRQKRKPFRGENPLKKGLTDFVSNPADPEYVAFCASRPAANRVLVPSFVHEYIDDIQPIKRHRMSHPEADIISLTRQTFEVVGEKERRSNGECAAGRRMIDMLLCALGPSEASEILGHIRSVDEGFDGRFASLLVHANAHLAE